MKKNALYLKIFNVILLILVAVFFSACSVDKPSFKVTVQNQTGGTITVSKESFHAGEKVVLNIELSENYKIKENSLKQNGIMIENNSFIMPKRNTTITVEYLFKNAITVNCNNDSFGTYTLSGQRAFAGEEVAISALPNANYRVVENKITINSSAYNLQNNAVTFTMPDAAVYISINFEVVPKQLKIVKIQFFLDQNNTTTYKNLNITEIKISRDYSQMNVIYDNESTLNFITPTSPNITFNSYTFDIQSNVIFEENKRTSIYFSAGYSGILKGGASRNGRIPSTLQSRLYPTLSDYAEVVLYSPYDVDDVKIFMMARIYFAEVE